ncbi:Transposable element Tc3 transposase [Anthophora plagiata]
MHRNWRNTIFSDEKKFNLDGPDGYNSYWRDLRKEPRYFAKRNFGGGSLMVWGAFHTNGMLKLAFPSKKMNSDEYISILQNNLLPFLQENNTINWSFQQDNASIHTSRKVIAWFEENDINIIKWPACSPDQNPMENIWGIIVTKVYAENQQYPNVSELKNAIIKISNEISTDIFRKLIDSVPDRVFELITKKGGPTKY